MSQTTMDVLAALVIYGAGTTALRYCARLLLRRLRRDD